VKHEATNAGCMCNHKAARYVARLTPSKGATHSNASRNGTRPVGTGHNSARRSRTNIMSKLGGHILRTHFSMRKRTKKTVAVLAMPAIPAIARGLRWTTG
jgi:hypothetical protein